MLAHRIILTTNLFSFRDTQRMHMLLVKVCIPTANDSVVSQGHILVHTFIMIHFCSMTRIKN